LSSNQAFWSAFPDSQISILEIEKENNKIVCRFSVTGNHRGTSMDIQATNKDIKLEGITILQSNDDNKCIKRWNQADSLGSMYQISAILILLVGMQSFYEY